MVGQWPLKPLIGVRIPVSQLTTKNTHEGVFCCELGYRRSFFKKASRGFGKVASSFGKRATTYTACVTREIPCIPAREKTHLGVLLQLQAVDTHSSVHRDNQERLLVC